VIRAHPGFVYHECSEQETSLRDRSDQHQPGAPIMYTTAEYFITQSTIPVANSGLALYNAALARGWLKRIGAALLGRNRTLRHLPTGHTTVRRYSGVQSIAIRGIVGSEDRSGDFDRDFNPLRETLRDRWLSVYRARVSGVPLSPIELVRGPDGYYVRDGHHRLSVARALGLDYVEALIIA
jgi:hypothetical protein